MKNKHIFILAGLVLSFTLLLSSCAKKPAAAPTTSLRILFTPKWGSDDFKLNTTYQTSTGYVNFSSFGMYLSHIRLIASDDTEVEADSAVLLLYANNTIAINLPAIKGTYKGIKFGIGLDSIQNNISPAAVPANDPVYANSALYWPSQLHLFIRLDGLSGTSATDPETPTTYDIGFNAFYRRASVSKSFTVSDGITTTLNLQADLSGVFSGANAVNVITEPATNSTVNPQIATKVADNFTQIFSIR